MAETLPAQRKSRNRGSLHSFYDPKLQQSLYGKREDKSKSTSQKASFDGKRSALVPIANGRFEIDRKVLLEECAADFDKAWFFKSATRAISHRLDSSTMQAFNPKTVDYVPDEESEHVSVGKDLISKVTQRFESDLHDVKLHNSKFTSQIKSPVDRLAPVQSFQAPVQSLLNEKTVAKPEGDEVRELFHNASVNNSIDTFVKRKYAASRVNLGLGLNSPDIILFRECLKKNVLPPGSIELEWRSTDGSLHAGSSYDHTASVQHLAQISSSLLGRSSIQSASADRGHRNFNNSVSSEMENDTHDGHEENANRNHNNNHNNNHVSGGASIGSLDSSDILGIENEQIYSINLNNKGIGDERGICLSAALSYCPHLCVIKLSNNRLNDRALSMVLNAVFNITYCEELDISCNAVGDISTKCLAGYLQVSHCALRKLNLRRCKVDDVNCAILCEALYNNESLEFLDLSSNNLGKYEELTTLFGKEVQGAVAIAELLVNNSTLQELRVSACSIHKQFALTFAEKLALNQGLLRLDLSHNELSDQEARRIGKALHAHRTLTHLDLSFNSLGSKAAITVAYAAQLPESALQYINLNGNSIGKLAGVYMLRAMRTVAAYPYAAAGHSAHTSEHNTAHTPTAASAATTSSTVAQARRMLTIDYKVTVTQFKDDSIYDLQRPSKSYSLQLSDPYDYTVARMLLDMADRHPTAAFKSIRHLHPNSRLWEFIHLGRGGLFEHPADFGLTSQQVWNSHLAEINTAIATLQAAQIAEMQNAGANGTREKGRRRQAFRAVSSRKASTLDSPDGSPVGPSKRFSVAMLSTDPLDEVEDAAKESRQKSRSARHALLRIGMKLGFTLEEEILQKIIEKLCMTTAETRAKFVTLLEIIYQELFHVLSRRVSTLKAQDEASRMKLPVPLLAEHMALFGVHKDTDVNAVLSAAERARRLISECDLSEESVLLSQQWYLQLMLSRQVESLAPTSRTYWAALNTTHHYVVPSEGVLQVELTYPMLCPTVHNAMSNAALQALLTQVSQGQASEHALDQISQVLLGTSNELYLTCVQAEIVLARFARFKSHSHFALVESLLYQMLSAAEARRFVVRNLYFNEILSMRRKLNYLFKVLTGNVTGHYLLDLRNEQHRCTVLRLAELNTFHQMQVMKRDIEGSQLGGGDCFRNASYNGLHLPLDSAWCESLPEVGQLRFDYVSPLRAPEGIPPSAGSWGCSFEGYNPTLAPEPPLPGEGEDSAKYANFNTDDLYNETAELNAKFSTLHGKEQFVQELVENLFAKKFEPRSRAKRKETRASAKNVQPSARVGAGLNSGKFVAQVAKGLQVATERADFITRKVTYVERMKGLTAERAARAGAKLASAEAAARPSALTVSFPPTLPPPLVDPPPVADLVIAAPEELHNTSSESSEDDYFTRDDDTEEESSSPNSPHSPHSRHGSGSPTNKSNPKKAFAHLKSNHTGLEPKKKAKKRTVNKFMELYIAEVSDYWKDLAGTSWVRCRAAYVEQLKKMLMEGVAEEYRQRPPDKDINAAIPPGAYRYAAYVAVKNAPVFKSVGIQRAVRRRPASAMGGLSYSLHSTSAGGNSKKFSVLLDNETAEDLAAGMENAISTNNSNLSSAVTSSKYSVKFESTSMSMKAGRSGKSGKISSLAPAPVANASASEDNSAAAVQAKLAFEKFLLRLEVVSMYNMWITTDQLTVILQALLAHSAPVSVIVRSICALFNHLTDRAAFYRMVTACQDQLRRELVHRLGILNVWSPSYPDGKMELDLAARDHREALRIMVQLLYEKGSTNELVEVVYFKDSILDAPHYLTSRNHHRANTNSNTLTYTHSNTHTTTTSTFRAGASEKDPFGHSSNNNNNNSNNNVSDNLPLTWLPPEHWGKPEPQGPPHCGHLHFTFRSTVAPAYAVF